MSALPRHHGFSLIELMVVVTILAILGTIAFPIYTNYTHRSKRASAKVALTSLSQAEEIFFGDHKTYGTVSDLTSAANTLEYVNADGTLSNVMGSGALYQISIGPLTPPGGSSAIAACTITTGPMVDYVVVATPLNFQLKDTPCMTLCLGSDGERGASAAGTDPTKVADCWAK